MLRLRRDGPLYRFFTVLFHPPIQQILLKTPAITKFECNASYLFLTQVLVQRVWGDPEVLRRFTQRHYFLLFIHFLACLSQTTGCFLGVSYRLLAFYYRVPSLFLPRFLDA